MLINNLDLWTFWEGQKLPNFDLHVNIQHWALRYFPLGLRRSPFLPLCFPFSLQDSSLTALFSLNLHIHMHCGVYLKEHYDRYLSLKKRRLKWYKVHWFKISAAVWIIISFHHFINNTFKILGQPTIRPVWDFKNEKPC